MPFVQGIYRSPLNSPHKGQWRGAFMCPLQPGKIWSIRSGTISWLLMPCSLGRKAISSHDTECEIRTGFPRGSISTSCVMTVWRSNMYCRYVFCFSWKNLVRKADRYIHHRPALVWIMARTTHFLVEWLPNALMHMHDILSESNIKHVCEQMNRRAKRLLRYNATHTREKAGGELALIT